MATVTLNKNPVTLPLLKYSDLKAGDYIIDNEGMIYAVVYNSHNYHSPTVAEVKDPSNTYTDMGMPRMDRTYRLLEKGENFTVTI